MKKPQLLNRLLLAHYAVLLAHAGAHLYHGVGAANALDGVVIFAGNYFLLAVGWVLLRRPNPRAGLYVLLLAVGLAFVHGVVNHFMLESPDHVRHFGASPTGWWFVISAGALAVVDGAIAVVTLRELVGKIARPNPAD